MKTVLLTCVLGLLLLTSGVLAADLGVSEGSKMIKTLTTAPVSFAIPQIGKEVQRVALDNGLIVFLYEDHRIPMISVQMQVHCGGVYDPADKNGLSGLVGSVIRSGGTRTIPADSLNNLLEFIGGSIEVNIGSESGTASLNVLSKDTDLGLKLLADVLRNPAFPLDKLDMAKVEIKNNIKRRNDDLGGVGSRSFRNTLYGAHPAGRTLEWKTVKGITVQDLTDYHKRFFGPNNMMLAVSGDFVSTDLIAKIREYFGDWAKIEMPLPAPPAVVMKYNPGVFQVHKETNQTNVNIGMLGIKRGNPDIPAIDVMNYILGGGAFASRLTSKVRSDEGLSYRVGSSFETGLRDYGAFYAFCQTKSATTFKAVNIIVDEISKMSRVGATEKEVAEAKEALLNRFAFTFDSPGKIARNLMGLEFDGYPSDYYQKYLEALRKVTVADVKAVAQKYLKPNHLSIVVVGDPKNFEKPLSQFGRVTDIQLTPPDLN